MKSLLAFYKNYKKTFIVLLLIFLLALMLRLVNLSNIPNSLHIDELNVGYQGYKIIKTGSDINGNILPIYIDKFGDYRPAGIFYLTGISTYLFGFNNFAVRLPIALVASLTVFPLFWLTYLISKNRNIALFAGLFLAISPWHIIASRATSESLVALFLATIGTCFLIIALQQQKKKYFIFSFFAFIVSYFFSPLPRLFIPAFLVLLTGCFSFFPGLKKGQKISLIILFTAILLITAGISFTKFGTGRFNQVSIFASKDIHDKISALQDVDHGNILTARIFHNKPVIIVKTFIDQYLSYFSPEYLYIHGGLPARYAIDDMGLFYYIEFPILLLGLYFIVRKRNIYTLIPLIWLACAPLSAALTMEDSPNIQRSIFMVLPLYIIEGYGLYYFFQLIHRRLKIIFALVLCVIVFVNMVYFFHMYFVHSPTHISFLRNDGNKELFTYLQQHDSNYDAVYVPTYGDLPMYYSFFAQRKENLLSVTREQYEKNMTIGKYHFVTVDCPADMMPNEERKKKIL